MLLSCTWLSELLGRPIDLSPVSDPSDPFTAANLAAKLTSLGLEVEGLHYADLPGVIVGRIDGLAPHPDATKLTVVQLFDGTATRSVVCGASNLPGVGGRVAFAPVGAVLPGGLELSERELRGVLSQGMICSEDELEIGGDSDGILVLPADWEPGALLRDLVPCVRDAVIEISVTPNRPDALGHVGVARDLALALGCELHLPAVSDVSAVPTTDALVELAAPERCPRYLGFALDGATIGPAPLWMRVRLHRVGLRALNNVVDVTNFVLMECGQPMHAFDRARLAEGRVVVRQAAAGEPMTLLDETKLELDVDDLVIADAQAPQALAGVMGGEHSMVEDATTQLLLEVAFFEPSAIRRSGRRYGLHTDSSHRFERQVDYAAGLELAADRAVHLLEAHCGARCVQRQDARGPVPVPAPIPLDPAHVSGLLGMDIAAEEVARILAGLGVALDRSEAQSWQCTPPSYRPDLTRDVDLIEEVMRHHGLDDLPARHSNSPEELEPLPESPGRDLAEAVANGLRGRGLHEHIGLAFIAEAPLEPLAGEFEANQLVRPKNPMSNLQACMRPHLLPGLLDAVSHNHARHARALGLFEVGRVYLWPTTAPAALAKSDADANTPSTAGPTAGVDRWLPDEPFRAAAIRAQRGPGRSGDLAQALTRDLLACLGRVGLAATARSPGPSARVRPWLHPGIQAGIWIGEREVGIVGELHPDLVAARDLRELELAYGELWIEALPPLPVVQYRDIARFPATTRDLSLDLDDAVSAHDAVAALIAAAATPEDASTDAPPILASAEDPSRPVAMIEDYRGDGVDAGRHALLLRLSYRAHRRSVTDAEVQPLHDRIVAAALDTLRQVDPGARVR